MSLVYVAGPLRPRNGRKLRQNIDAAAEHALDLWERGHAVICPHTNTQLGDMDPDRGGIRGVPGETFLAGDLVMVSRCDVVYMLPGWEESEGARMEHDFAKAAGITVYYAPEEVPL
jgi:hypothetical protein